jgi:hypothetical protein
MKLFFTYIKREIENISKPKNMSDKKKSYYNSLSINSLINELVTIKKITSESKTFFYELIIKQDDASLNEKNIIKVIESTHISNPKVADLLNNVLEKKYILGSIKKKYAKDIITEKYYDEFLSKEYPPLNKEVKSYFLNRKEIEFCIKEALKKCKEKNSLHSVDVESYS